MASANFLNPRDSNGPKRSRHWDLGAHKLIYDNNNFK
jgi:hypothetical protein